MGDCGNNCIVDDCPEQVFIKKRQLCKRHYHALQRLKQLPVIDIHEVANGMKKCGRCKEIRQVGCFAKNRSRKDGLDLTCKNCRREYYAINSERIIARNSKWAKENRERNNAYKKLWRKRNPEKSKVASRRKYLARTEEQRLRYLENVKRWNSENKDRLMTNIANSHHRRRQKMKDGTYLVTPKELASIRKGTCALCGGNENICVDHIIPLSKGGRHSIGNLQPLCRHCNSRKRDRLWAYVRYKM